MQIENPSLLILGGGACQLHAFEMAKRRGIDTLLFDYLPHPPAAALANRHVRVSTFDAEACIEAAKKQPLLGVMTLGTDQPVYTAARVADALSLPTLLDIPTAYAVTHKGEMKWRLKAAGIPCVPWRLVDRETLPAADFEGPVVLKPLDSQGQRGVQLCASVAEAVERYDATAGESREAEVLLEQYYPSDEATISAWVTGGRTRVLTITDRITFPAEVHIGICAAHRYPSHAARGQEGAMAALTQRIAEAFRIQEGPLYIQVLFGARGALVNEIACRIGGAFEDVFIPYLTGFDILGAVMDAALGLPVPAPELRHRDAHIRELMLFARPGTVAALTPIETLRALPFVLDAGYSLGVGAIIPPMENASGRLGHAVLCAESEEEMARNLTTFYEALRVVGIEGEDMLLRKEG